MDKIYNKVARIFESSQKFLYFSQLLTRTKITNYNEFKKKKITYDPADL